jgi:hypothetical protein
VGADTDGDGYKRVRLQKIELLWVSMGLRHPDPGRPGMADRNLSPPHVIYYSALHLMLDLNTSIHKSLSYRNSIDSVSDAVMDTLPEPAPDLPVLDQDEGGMMNPFNQSHELTNIDVCRVCRSEGDAEMPLIYPCKCAGSVRFVHADWLAPIVYLRTMLI